jgi:protein-serine/threonine kinase
MSCDDQVLRELTVFTNLEEFPLKNSSETYTRIKFLGQGATGEVYLVKCNATDQLYAMKRINKKLLNKKEIKTKRILNERLILLSIKHQGIISFKESFQSTSSYYLILEYVSNGTLCDLLKSKPMGYIKEDLARTLASEIFLVLEYVHSVGILYRDLKPENILLDADNHIKLSDFDLSKISAKSNSFVGTVEYMAPEVVNKLEYTYTSDWWSFGILLYEMVYGFTPFKGITFEDTLSKITKQKLLFPKHIHVSPEYKILIAKLLNKDPKKRPTPNEIRIELFD